MRAPVRVAPALLDGTRVTGGEPMMTPPKRNVAMSPGFSLSEMLTVLALMGLLILFGGPAMADAYRSYQVRTTADMLGTDVRALRYNAVAQRASQSMTIHNQGDSTTPNTYNFVNLRGQTVVRTPNPGVNIESTSATSISFNMNGSTGGTTNLTVLVSMNINGDRGDRYTISVTPSGTVSTSYSTYTPAP
jgi:prepilin-type N-terminal cleavage/methylation domain-containing protein